MLRLLQVDALDRHSLLRAEGKRVVEKGQRVMTGKKRVVERGWSRDIVFEWDDPPVTAAGRNDYWICTKTFRKKVQYTIKCGILNT